VLRIFIALKETIVLAGFEHATFGSSGKHTNHYTTKATCRVGTGGPFPGTKARPGRDSDHSSSSVEVDNEQELYLLSPPPQGPPWRVLGQLQ
jgi:hypothetical protein